MEEAGKNALSTQNQVYCKERGLHLFFIILKYI